MTTPLYMRHRAVSGDPWLEPPNITSYVPANPTASLPVMAVTIGTGPETESPCGCYEVAATEDYLTLSVKLQPMPKALAVSLVSYLLRYKQAALHEVKLAEFAQGNYVTGKLSLLRVKEDHGTLAISFRIAATISDALA